MCVVKLEKNVKLHLSFLKEEVCNLFVKVKKKVASTSVMDLLKFCEDAKRYSSKFQFTYRIGAKRKLEHIFWSSSHYFDWYQKYGDVVVFDTI